MLKNNLGYPRIGSQRELKKALEQYWAKKTTQQDLLATGASLRKENWNLQKQAGVDLIPSNDFSFYDQVLDTICMLGAIPKRYQSIFPNALAQYFAMARGYQDKDIDITAMEMTKWFDTNYHYIVPEFVKNQSFSFYSKKVLEEFLEAKALGIHTKPVLIGPISFLLLGKQKQDDFSKWDLLPDLVVVYQEILQALESAGATWVQIEEPFLTLDAFCSTTIAQAYRDVYAQLKQAAPSISVLLTTYFQGVKNQERANAILEIPFDGLHLDLVRTPEQLDFFLTQFPKQKHLSLGLIDGRNIWKTSYAKALGVIETAKKHIDASYLCIAPSCSLLHVPCDLDQEIDTKIDVDVLSWLSFAKQKLQEIQELYLCTEKQNSRLFLKNVALFYSKSISNVIHHAPTKKRLSAYKDDQGNRAAAFKERQKIQKAYFKLPVFPTTTIGSFPQTKAIRSLRSQFKKGKITELQYTEELKKHTQDCIALQEKIGLDVLVHGEFERNDMVEYFAERLKGFAFTTYGWVQSYGSRCVKPPIIYGDVYRVKPMTVFWSTYAQSLTDRPVKGMLTGPVTMLQWSFVRDDQSRQTTCNQIALAVLDEVQDLEKQGIKIIQVDEPAIREGLPLLKSEQQQYLDWAIRAFRLASSLVANSTQIHTHMCYSEFNDIISDIAAMDADVITIETSRSQMELLEVFKTFNYPNEIGPGVYDIHSPRVPSLQELTTLIDKAASFIAIENLWVNPDCGLKTRAWQETIAALELVVAAAKISREKYTQVLM